MKSFLLASLASTVASQDVFLASTPNVTASRGLEQFTPDQAEWSTFQTKPMASKYNNAHDPDSVTWIHQDKWEAARWNGVPINPSGMTKSQLQKAICPSGDTILGLREVFYENKPFRDNKNPTKAEVDEWHRIAINHVRHLVGYTEPERQIQKDHCMFARALWGDERMHTTQWDTSHPALPSGCGSEGSACGPCQHSSNPHCGASFMPTAAEQAPYLPSGHGECHAGAGAEGIFSGPKSNIPWSLKFSRALCATLGSDGMSAHSGPWFHRSTFGFSFWDSDPNNFNNNAVLRAKWGGTLMPNKYENTP